jgi:hypothetical protein
MTEKSWVEHVVSRFPKLTTRQVWVVIVLVAASGMLYLYKNNGDESTRGSSTADVVGNENVSLNGIGEIHGGLTINRQPTAMSKPVSPVIFNDIPSLDLKLKTIRFPAHNEVFRVRLISDKWSFDHEIDIPRNARVQDVITEIVSKLHLSEYVVINFSGETESQWILKINGEEVGPEIVLDSAERFPPGSVLQLFFRWKTITYVHPTSQQVSNKQEHVAVHVVPRAQVRVNTQDDIPL